MFRSKPGPSASVTQRSKSSDESPLTQPQEENGSRERDTTRESPARNFSFVPRKWPEHLNVPRVVVRFVLARLARTFTFGSSLPPPSFSAPFSLASAARIRTAGSKLVWSMVGRLRRQRHRWKETSFWRDAKVHRQTVICIINSRDCGLMKRGFVSDHATRWSDGHVIRGLIKMLMVRPNLSWWRVVRENRLGAVVATRGWRGVPTRGVGVPGAMVTSRVR